MVLTLGAQGCLWAAEEGLGFVPAPAVEPVDTTGAGDAFAAGFLHAFCRGEGLAASARMGSATAGRCICVRGPDLRGWNTLTAGVIMLEWIRGKLEERICRWIPTPPQQLHPQHY